MARSDKAATPATLDPTKSAAKPTSKAAKPVTADWERIELDYRAGVKTLRQIADEHGITHGAINKRAKRDGWERDLATKIQAKADALVSKAAVSKPVSTETRIAEREVIEANATAIADVRLAHRRDIQRTRGITMRLLEELEYQTGAENVFLLEQMGELLRSEDDKGQDKLNDLYQKIISLPGRAKTMKDLGESLRVLVALERQAFGLDDKDNAPVDALTSLLHGIATTNGNAFAPVAQDPEHDED
ncbi:terminase small subunit [Pseudomonas phage 8P]|nr:terminase small subunit [Pseudomonas phage 8P]